MIAFTEYIKSLYIIYSEDLKSFRDRLKEYHNKNIFNSQLEDIACELTYLCIRDRKPNTIIEISPNYGWSSLVICMAIQDGNLNCNYSSYDILDNSEKLLPNEFKAIRKFVLGDVRNHKFDESIDYLFMDSEHTYTFGQWYFDNLFPLLSSNGIMSIHDMNTESGELWHTVSKEINQQESKFALEFCSKNNINLWIAQHHYTNFKDIRKQNIDNRVILTDNITSIAFIDKKEKTI